MLSSRRPSSRWTRRSQQSRVVRIASSCARISRVAAPRRTCSCFVIFSPDCIPVFVLVRPRAGDFVYTAAEHRTMREQIERAKSAGAYGIVTGALTGRQEIDEVRTSELIAAARLLPVTFHRAFDRLHGRQLQRPGEDQRSGIPGARSELKKR